MSHQSDWSNYQGQEPIKLPLIKKYRSYEYFRLEIRVTAIFVFLLMGPYCCLVPRRRSLIERDALWVMGLIIAVRKALWDRCKRKGERRFPQGFRTIIPRAPCFPAVPPLTQQRLGTRLALLHDGPCWSDVAFLWSSSL